MFTNEFIIFIFHLLSLFFLHCFVFVFKNFKKKKQKKQNKKKTKVVRNKVPLYEKEGDFFFFVFTSFDAMSCFESLLVKLEKSKKKKSNEREKIQKISEKDFLYSGFKILSF